MRVNVYAEEMTDRIAIITKVIDGQPFTGLRFYLELPTTVDGQQYKGPFMHRPGDDDSSAVTFWGKRDLRIVLRKALAELDQHYTQSASDKSETAQPTPMVDYIPDATIDQALDAWADLFSDTNDARAKHLREAAEAIRKLNIRVAEAQTRGAERFREGLVAAEQAVVNLRRDPSKTPWHPCANYALLDAEAAIRAVQPELPAIGSLWKHHNGNVYKVVCFTNIESTRPDKYPLTVVYQNVANKKLYSRRFCDWHRSMTTMPQG